MHSARTRWLLLLATSIGLSACTRTPAPRAPALAPGPLLWEVEKDGKRSYVFATGPAGIALQEISPLVWKTFRKSRSLAVVHGKRTPRPHDFNQRLRDPQAKGLSKRLNGADLVKLAHEMRGLITPVYRLEFFHPTVVAFILTRWGKPLNGATEHLLYQAEQRNILTIVLDPQRFTTNTVIDAFGPRYLRRVLRNVPKERDVFDARVRNYRSGNLSALTRIANEQTHSDYDDPAFWIRYYAQPSTSWLDKMKNALDEGSLFIAMDSDAVLHRTGLLSGLRKRGYRLTRLGARTQATVPSGRIWRLTAAACRKELDHRAGIFMAATPSAQLPTRNQAAKAREHFRPAFVNRCLKWTKTVYDCHRTAKTRHDIAACRPKGCYWDKRDTPFKLICP